LAAENAKEQPKPAGGESAINSAPPVPGQETTRAGQEQPIQPAPAVPTGSSQQAGQTPQERAIRPAPTIPVSGSQEQQIAGPGAVPMSGPPSGPTGERPLASAPQVPVSGTQETKLAGPAPATGQVPTAGQIPIGGQLPMPTQAPMPAQVPTPAQTPMAGAVPSAVPQQPGVVAGETPLAQAPTAGVPVAGQTPQQPAQPGYAHPTYGAGQSYPAGPTGVQGEVPMSNPGMVQGAGYPTPMAPGGPVGMPNPGWGQPPSYPPPVPPPNEPLAPHQQVGPVGNVAGQPQPGGAGTTGTPVVSGDPAGRNARTNTARTLRRRSRERSSYFAIMFMSGAALFLLFVVIVLVVSLM